MITTKIKLSYFGMNFIRKSTNSLKTSNTYTYIIQGGYDKFCSNPHRIMYFEYVIYFCLQNFINLSKTTSHFVVKTFHIIVV